MSSSSKSRNFRRRADDGGNDEEEDKPSSLTPINGTSSNAKKPSVINKPKKTPSQPPTKSLLSFADDEESESPFSRPSSKPSSSRFSKSTHKLAPAKDRIATHPPSSSLPSNVQPQAGTYTKEALLELQKSTKTLAASSRSIARAKPKPEPEPVIVLKGLVKPAVMADPDAKTTAKPFEDNGVPSGESDEDVARFGSIKLGTKSREDEEEIPDQAMIQAIRAKRERLRQAKAAAPDFIALDGGSNHGAAEGLSDEEPEFRGRIGFFGDKIDGNKKGVFEDFEERSGPRDRGSGSGDSDEDEEDKMWEEEQVRKGLGKRMDDGIGSKGASSGISGNSVHQTVQQPSFAYSTMGTTGVYSSTQTVGVGSGYSSIGGAFGGSFGSDVMPIAQQAELAKKALHENVTRLQESHGRTMATLVKADENLSASLVNVTTLENSFAAASEKFLFMQKLRDFVSVICDFLQHKAPFIEELEEQMQKLHEKRAAAIIRRRDADNDDEMLELEPAILAARAALSKGGSNVAMISAATAAAQAASANARASKNLPVELDEFGRDMNLQKGMDTKRRAEARQRTRAKTDSKRMSAMDIDTSYQQIEGESSTDESDNESAAYESTRNELLQVAEKVFGDAAEEYSQLSFVIERFERWKKDYASSYRDAYMSLSIPAIFSPYVRVELLKWDPLHEDADFIDMKWHSLLFNYGISEDESKISPDDDADADANLIPELVGKLAIPILHHQLAFCWDMLSTRETKLAVSAMNLVFRYVDLSSSELVKLVTVLRERLTDAVANLTVPTWNPLEMKAVPNAARVAAYRFGTSVRLLKNICLWNKILAMPFLEKLALDELLSGKLLPHLRSIQSDVHDAITRSERIVASLHGVWAGPSVPGDRSPKLQPLVDYLMLIGKSLEKKHAVEAETGKLVRRLKKMLVELNEYDNARALSRTFNLKEAL